MPGASTRSTMRATKGLKDGLFSRISQITTIGFMISSLVGAYIADINIAWPWLCGAAGYVIAGDDRRTRLMTGEKKRASPASILRDCRVMIVRRMVERSQRGFPASVPS